MGIKETLKDFGEKVKENPTLLLIPAGAIGGIYLLMKSNEPEMVPAPLSVSAPEKVSSSGGGSGGMEAGSDVAMSQLAGEFNQAFNDLSGQFMDFQANTVKALQESDRAFSSLSMSMAEELEEQQIKTELENTSKMIYGDDDRRDDIQYYSASRDRDKDERRVIAGTGNDGKGWANDDTWKGFMEDVKSSSKLKESELERADNVIANRKELGLDTSRQERYKEQLKNDFKDFN